MFGRRPDTERLLRHLEIVAFAVLVTWSLIGLYGTLGGILEVNRFATIRFLFVILLVVFAHDVYVRVRERRLRQLPPDERYGFTERSGYHLATGSSQPQG
jgi:hypothetical protein